MICSVKCNDDNNHGNEHRSRRLETVTIWSLDKTD